MACVAAERATRSAKLRLGRAPADVWPPHQGAERSGVRRLQHRGSLPSDAEQAMISTSRALPLDFIYAHRLIKAFGRDQAHFGKQEFLPRRVLYHDWGCQYLIRFGMRTKARC
jgi:hypothetical protein